ncbi:MAG: gliding motility protein GldM [Bacteroidota bacterium]
MAANNKLSPRQRMINMMYLVLTAMLALQVSSSIVDKFIFLNDSLENSFQSSVLASENALKALKEKVKEEGNSPKGLRSIKRAEELKEQTAIIVRYIDRLKKELSDQAGGGIDPETGLLVNPKEETKVETFMIGPSHQKQGKAYELKGKLDVYVDFLYQSFGDYGFKKPRDPADGPFPYLAEGNEKRDIYKNDPIQNKKDFAQANFGQTPVVAALAVLTQKQNEILRYEQEVLKKLGIEDLKYFPDFDRIVAVAAPEVRTIAQGEEYSAEMFLTAFASRSDIEMFVNGQKIAVNNGKGKVRIPATQAGKNSWTGEIKFKVDGQDTVFRFNEAFEVVKPTLLINNRNKFPLYQNCANELETSVPALAAAYDPSFQVSNGKSINGSRVGDVTLIPNRVGNCKLTVRSKGRLVGSQDFVVNPVPAPTIFLGNRNKKPVQQGRPIPNVPRIYIYPQADATFAKTLPREANYQIAQMEVTLFRSGSAKGRQRIQGNAIDLTSLGARPGDGIQVNVSLVYRINSQGHKEQVRPVNPYLSFFIKG